MTTREKILATAKVLFIKNGFDNTTIRDICLTAEVNVAAVNYHFRGKQQLMEAIIADIVEKCSLHRLEIVSNRTINNEKEWRQVIIDFINSIVLENDSSSQTELALLRLFINTMKNRSEFFTQIHRKYFAPLDRQLIRYIEMGLPDDAPPGAAALWVMTIISQCFMFKHHNNILNNLSNIDFSLPENASQIAEHIAETVFAGLKYRNKA